MAAFPENIEVPIRVKSLDVPVNVQLNIGLSLEVDGQEQSNFDDVGDFHEKFDLDNVTHRGPGLRQLDLETLEFRIRRLRDELEEIVDGVDAADDAEVFDGLMDLVYIALGTAHLLGYPWQEGWDEVQRANMSKERAKSAEDSPYGTTQDIIKPEGWTAPDIRGVLNANGWE